jgi:hypothetical protein
MDINIKIPKKYREVKSLNYGTANYLYDWL